MEFKSGVGKNGSLYARRTERGVIFVLRRKRPKLRGLFIQG